MSQPTVMDARIALHILRAWGRERIEIRQPVTIVDSSLNAVTISPCPTKGEDGWRFKYDHRECDRADAKRAALQEIEDAVAIVVPKPVPGEP